MQKSFMSISLVVIAISMLAMFIYSFFTTKYENGYQISINRPSHCADYCSNPDYDSLYDLFVRHHGKSG